MKKILLLGFLFHVLWIYGQNEKVYYFKQGVNIESYDIVAKNKTNNNDIAQRDWKFVVDSKVTGGRVIRFLKWRKRSEYLNTSFYSQEVFNAAGKKTGEKPKYFFISDTDFDNNTDVYENDNPRTSFVTGAITIPIKIRPGGDEKDEMGNTIRPFDFSGEVNVGLSVGIKFRLGSAKSKVYFIPTAGINLTSVSIDETTVRNGVITSKTNASSLTPFTGFVIQYDTFQLAMITGWDRLSGKTGENWVYQGRPWFGIGLGYSIFNTQQSAKKND